jgi:hypothetical protein
VIEDFITVEEKYLSDEVHNKYDDESATTKEAIYDIAECIVSERLSNVYYYDRYEIDIVKVK